MSSTIWLLIIGAVAGWLAGQFVRGHGFGIWVDMIVGVVGAFIGSYLLAAIGIGTYGLIGELIASFVGAVILVSIIRMFSGNPARDKT
ncbi:GlsB/YeaQ/YmgE family stress response membrane protein [Sporomusa sp.]|uniref:GlsB/YeaQ/YmgE family stress response membrane protein n=1 Tax=Sporomusa sp. TaxID=2078658 RepID=UPI002CE281C2|nr:GlsB/YeaQ/YmgE family stress response membrane protein [Sporomusa sp.]HWR45899.1 GlsB/YeaQ/YmgE family stress response membrane protein [Sporomusa sp.]